MIATTLLPRAELPFNSSDRSLAPNILRYGILDNPEKQALF